MHFPAYVKGNMLECVTWPLPEVASGWLCMDGGGKDWEWEERGGDGEREEDRLGLGRGRFSGTLKS